ncbi:hypothetical protein NW762_006531 [Fusarium torreyae]|uniref:Trihydrophobin n=1 Tax=Fusarium torreyae TaxID=1237075 RepID=A0A9W8S1A3_9HYPO|nr:hypothetical protein NW762_006531 [Fusarium torreyae]
MQFSLAVVALLGSFVSALPATEKRQAYVPCSGLYGTSQCCATDVLGVADLDCGNPPSVPANATDFQSVCHDIGQRARCCVLPILDQGILCNNPTGVED